MPPSNHLSPWLNQHLDRFSHFCTAHGRVSSDMSGMPIPLKIALSHGRSGTPDLIRGFLDPPDWAFQMVSRSVQPFLQGSGQSVPILYNGPTLSSKTAPSHGGSGPPSNRWLLEPTRADNPTGISTGSAAFAGLTTVTERPTDRPKDRATRSVKTGSIYGHSTAMQLIMSILCLFYNAANTCTRL